MEDGAGGETGLDSRGARQRIDVMCASISRRLAWTLRGVDVKRSGFLCAGLAISS